MKRVIVGRSFQVRVKFLLGHKKSLITRWSNEGRGRKARVYCKRVRDLVEVRRFKALARMLFVIRTRTNLVSRTSFSPGQQQGGEKIWG